MLILTRRVGEAIELKWPDGRTVVITLAKIKGSTTARIGIEAGADCKILRSELSHEGRPAA